MQPDLSIVIVNFNAHTMLADCLKSIRENSAPLVVQVIVVDNGSSDGSVEMMQERFSEVLCIANKGNLGYTKANNVGLRSAEGRHVMLLNNDTLVRPQALSILVDFLDSHPMAGAVGPRVLNPDGSTQGTFKNLPTPAAALFGRRSILTRLFPNNRFSRDYLVYRHVNFGEPFAVGSAATCALAVARRALEVAGELDEGYSMYWVDVDWCRSIWDNGLQVLVHPTAEIVHYEHKGGSRAGITQSWRSIVGFHNGAYRYYRKHHIKSSWSLRNAFAVAGLTARAILVLATSLSLWLLNRLNPSKGVEAYKTSRGRTDEDSYQCRVASRQDVRDANLYSELAPRADPYRDKPQIRRSDLYQKGSG